MHSPSKDLLALANGRRFKTILADPPWQFQNKTGKVAPEHRRLNRYATLKLDEIKALPLAADTAHLYLWVPNALLPDGIEVLRAWGFQYKSNMIWHKVRKDGGSDGRGVGFYFRNVTEVILFGVRGKNARTLAPGRLAATGSTCMHGRARLAVQPPAFAFPTLALTRSGSMGVISAALASGTPRRRGI